MENNRVRRVIKPAGAAPLSVPLSPAVQYGELLFISGQVSMDVKNGVEISGSIEDETRRALMNLSDLLEQQGSSLASVLKVTVYLTDFGDYEGMNSVYAEFFPNEPPARTTIGNIALAKTYRVEIEAIAYIP